MRQERRSRPSERRGSTHANSARSVAADFAPVWLTVSQLCRRWQLGRKTVYKFIDARILPAWKVGSHLYRVAVADVLRFEARNRFGRDANVNFP
jgi:excisionase family DNA binding protein